MKTTIIKNVSIVLLATSTVAYAAPKSSQISDRDRGFCIEQGGAVSVLETYIWPNGKLSPDGVGNCYRKVTVYCANGDQYNLNESVSPMGCAVQTGLPPSQLINLKPQADFQ